jgi:hypothetical protein
MPRNEGETISLDGSGSSDPGGSIAAYAWDLDGDNQYDDATGISPNFTLPAAGSLTTIGLRVTDNEGATDTDTATVNINGLPTADAGGPYSGNEGETISLDGSGSSDPGGSITRAKRSAWMAPGRLTQAAASPLTRGTSMETISMTTPRVSARTSPCRLLAVSQQSACG